MVRRMLVACSILLLLVSLASSASAQCGVYKTWSLNEVLTSSDINQAFSRTVTANTAACVTGDSPSVGQMRVVVNPFPGGAESLATTTQGELERLRFQFQALVGKTYWYEVIDNSLAKDVSKHWGATFTSYAEIADPPPPGLNDLRLYAKDDGAGVTVLAYKDSNGIVNTLTGPSTSYGSSVTVNFLAQNNAGTPNTKLDLSANRISVAGFIKESFTSTIDVTTTGANALDTGTVAANTGYAIWVIYNPVANTFAGLASTSETAPTMPSGYTKKRMLGKFSTDASAHFRPGVQTGPSFALTTPVPIGVCFGPGGPVQTDTLQLFVPNKYATAAGLVVNQMNNVAALAKTFKAGSLSFAAGAVIPSAPVHLYTNTAVQSEWFFTVTLPLRNPNNRGTIFVETIGDCSNFWVTSWEMEWPD